jgi:HEAT repeat protein
MKVRDTRLLTAAIAVLVVGAAAVGWWYARSPGRRVRSLLLQLDERDRQANRIEEYLGHEPSVDFLSVRMELIEMGPSAVKPLMGALDDEDWLVRHVAVLALGEIGDSLAAPAMAERLEDTEEIVRYEAAAALGKLGDPRGADWLSLALSDSSSFVREQAVRSLVRIGPPAAAAMRPALEDHRPEIRNGAVVALGGMGGDRAAKLLIEKLADESETDLIRMEAMWALGRMGSEGAVVPLAEHLGNPDLAEVATEALVQIGPASEESLIAALGSDDEGARRQASMALGSVGSARAVRPLIETMAGEPVPAMLAAEALERIGRPAVAPLIEALPSAGDARHPLWSAAARRRFESAAPPPEFAKLSAEAAQSRRRPLAAARGGVLLEREPRSAGPKNTHKQTALVGGTRSWDRGACEFSPERNGGGVWHAERPPRGHGGRTAADSEAVAPRMSHVPRATGVSPPRPCPA